MGRCDVTMCPLGPPWWHWGVRCDGITLGPPQQMGCGVTMVDSGVWGCGVTV